MTEEKKEPFNLKTLKIVLEKEIESRFAKYCSDQALATKDDTLSITQYIDTHEVENILERIISKLGGSSLEQGMVFVSVKDKNDRFVTSKSNCDKIFVSVAYGQKFIIKNREYPPTDNGAVAKEPPPISDKTEPKPPSPETPQPVAVPGKTPKPVTKSDGKPTKKAALNDDQIRSVQVLFAKELKRKLDELWINRKGLGVDFYNPGALKIELLQDSPRINKILPALGEKTLDIRIDKENGLIKVHAGGKIYLKWKLPEE
jgi:hypothetical protein